MHRVAKLLLLAIFLTVNADIWSAESDDQPTLIDNDQGKTMGYQAVDAVVRIYREEGIEPALLRATQLHAELMAIPPDWLVRVEGERFRSPVEWMEHALWYEAQLRSGEEDPEWGLAVFKWIDALWQARSSWQVRERVGPLVNNLLGRMRALGRLGESRLLIMEMEEALKAVGIHTLTRQQEDLGPWLAEIPTVRKRPFRIHRSEDRSGAPRFYSYRYFLSIGQIARQAYDEGDWSRAAELWLWRLHYATEYIKVHPEIVPTPRDGNQAFETVTMYESSVNSLAGLLELHGEYERALQLLNEMIPLNYRGYKGIHHDSAQMHRELLLIKLGQSDPGAPDRARAILQRYEEGKHASHGGSAALAADYAFVLAHYGRADEAWKLLADYESRLQANQAATANTLRMGKIRIALLTGNLDHVEEWLLECLEYARSRAQKMLEPELYELYAEYLAANERPSEAARMAQEAKRLYAGLGIASAVRRNSDKLAGYQRQSAQSAQPTEAPALDLQPEAMVSNALPGLPAYGRFALSNPSTRTIEGVFTVAGAPANLIRDDAVGAFALVVDGASEPASKSQTLSLAPNDQIIIDTVAAQPGSDGGELALTFQTNTGVSLTATWQYHSSSESVSKAFINASRVTDSPFYLVPIFHSLQRQSVEIDPITNFRFVASSPMRVEVYDSASGQLVYIDANGDGDLLDSGDQLAHDADRNGEPDVVFEADALTADLEVHFHTPPTTSTKRIELSLEMKVGDSWEPQSINQIDVSPKTQRGVER